MAAPTTITVTGTYVNADGTPAAGKVMFTPHGARNVNTANIEQQVPVVATLNASGVLSQVLVYNAAGYDVLEQITAPVGVIAPVPTSFTIAGTASLDLGTVSVPTVPPYANPGNFQGVWASATSYLSGNLVRGSDGNLYIANKPSVAVQPVGDASGSWSQMLNATPGGPTPLTYGGKGDAVQSTTGFYSGGVNGTLIDVNPGGPTAGNGFGAADVGKLVVAAGTTAVNTQLVGTIGSVTTGRVDAGATAASGATTITDAAITAADAGKPVTGTGIPAGCVVGAVTAGVSFVLNGYLNQPGPTTSAAVSGVTIGAGIANITGGNAATPASVAGTGTTYTYGSDDTTAINNWLAQGGSSLTLANKTYLYNGSANLTINAAVTGPGTIRFAGSYANATPIVNVNSVMFGVTIDVNNRAYATAPLSGGVIQAGGSSASAYGCSFLNTRQGVRNFSVLYGCTVTHAHLVVLSTPYTAGGTGSALVQLQAAGQIVQNCIITSPSYVQAISVTNAPDAKIFGNIITIGNAAGTATYYGINIDANSPRTIVEGNSFPITGPAAGGNVYAIANSSANVKVVANDASGMSSNGATGQFIANVGTAQAVEVIGNTIFPTAGGTGLDGGIVITGLYWKVADNFIAGGWFEGIVSGPSGAQASITGNIVYTRGGTNSYGIAGRGLLDSTIKANRIHLLLAGDTAIAMGITGDTMANARNVIAENHVVNGVAGAVNGVVIQPVAANASNIVSANIFTSPGGGAVSISDTQGTTGTRYINQAPGLLTSQPTAAAGANNGTGPPVPAFTAVSTDMAGVVGFGNGTTPAAGAQAVVTFATAYPAGTVPRVTLMPLTANAAALQAYVTVTNTGFTINSVASPGATATANTNYQFAYAVASA